MYSARITELEAINILLNSIGTTPVVTLDNPQNIDAINARASLTRALREVQMEKWYFNSEDNYTLTPDIDGYIYLPHNIINIDYSGRFGEYENYTVRDGRLYDLFNHTYIFTDTVTLNVILSLNFEEIPETAKQYVIAKAARKYQEEMLGDPNLRTWTAQDEIEARGKVMEEELRSRKTSFGLYPKLDSSKGIDGRQLF